MKIIKPQKLDHNLIYLNMRFLTQRITGVQRFAYELCCELDKLVVNYPQIKIVGLLPKRPIQAQYDTSKFSAISLKVCGKFGGHLWEQLELPFFARRGHLINLCNVAPLLHFNQSLTLHDVIFMTNLDSQKWWFKLWYRLIAWFTSRLARHVFTVSEFSKFEIIRYLAIAPSRITVLGNGASLSNYAYQDEVISRLSLTNQRYFLIIGSNSARKNINLVTSLFASTAELSHVKLVVVGGNYANLGAVNQVTAPNIIYTGYVSDGELRSLYHYAQALIFPSIYEGFGIPVIEAMAESCPVIVADIPVMHEVCGDCAIYFDPYQAEDLKRKLVESIESNYQNLNSFKFMASQCLTKYQWNIFAKKIISQLPIRRNE